ncbi:MAG: 5-formyltetrahydrofolate cyclo-ligase [Myxococcota bacterium]
MHTATAKADLRRRLRQMRRGLAEGALDRAAVAIAERAAAFTRLTSAKTIATYLAIRRELPTEPLRHALPHAGWAIPRISGETMVMVADRGLRIDGAFGVPTCEGPEVEVDVVIVPGLAFDAAGRRLGWGAGYYDRWLDGRDVIAVGLALDEAIVDEVPADRHDQRMHAILTPTRTLIPDNI